MIVLGLPGEAALQALGSGTSELRDDAPSLVFLGMAATMTSPMVAWMRYRGHRWQPTLEMAASMIIATLIAIALLAAGVLSFGALIRHAARRRRVHQPRPRRGRGLNPQPKTRRTGGPPKAGLLAPPRGQATARTAGGSGPGSRRRAISEAMYCASSFTQPRSAEPRVRCHGRRRKQPATTRFWAGCSAPSRPSDDVLEPTGGASTGPNPVNLVPRLIPVRVPPQSDRICAFTGLRDRGDRI